MLFSLKDIERFQLSVKGEQVGKIRAFLIDEDAWLIRYLVAGIFSRNVIIAARAFQTPDYVAEVLPLNISRERLLASPNFDPDLPLSRSVQRQFHDHYEWPYYWDEDEVPNTLPGDLTAVPLIEMELEREEQLVPQTGGVDQEDSHLYSTKGILGLPIHATNDDQNAGTLVDFIADDEDWRIQYMVVDTGGLFSGKKVALAPQWIQKFDEKESRILVDLKQETIQNSPSFSSTLDLTPEYLEQLRRYYQER